MRSRESEENVGGKEKGGKEKGKSRENERDKDGGSYCIGWVRVPVSIYYAVGLVCVRKGEKEGHILYLWVFAATVLSRRGRGHGVARRLVAES